MAVDEEYVLATLKALGPQLERIEKKRSELYEQQNELVVLGDSLGLSAIDMARARRPKGDPKYIAESFRQVIRKNREHPG